MLNKLLEEGYIENLNLRLSREALAFNNIKSIDLLINQNTFELIDIFLLLNEN